MMAETEYGVELPNGTIQWGVALGRPLSTVQERALFNQAVHNTAKEVGWPEDEFVGRYKWRSRDIEVNERSKWALDDETIAVVPPVEIDGS
jgi:hypothetical protein